MAICRASVSMCCACSGMSSQRGWAGSSASTPRVRIGAFSGT